MNDYTLVIGGGSDLGKELILDLIQNEQKIISISRKNQKEFNHYNNYKNYEYNFVNQDYFDDVGNEIYKSHGVPKNIVHFVSKKIKFKNFKSNQWSDFEEELRVGLKSMVESLRFFLPLMAKEKKGKVVIILSSLTEKTHTSFLSHYITSKHAMLGLTKSLVAEYGRYNIQINALSPSMFESKFLSEVDKNLIDLIKSTQNNKNFLDTKKIISSINFLLSNKSDFISGVNLLVEK